MQRQVLIGICVVVSAVLLVSGLVWWYSVPQVVQESGSISVTMCPECEETFLSLLRGGGAIRCALYDYGPDVERTLRDANAHVLTDDEDGGNYGVQIAQDGLMHNKFCILNKTIVTSGSYNPTANGELNRNNLVVIESPTLVRNYEKQYQAIARGGWRRRITPVVELGDIRVQNAFCPNDDCEAQVNDILAQAEQEIVYFHYTFTSERLTRTLEEAATRGVRVEGVCDGGQWNVQGGKCSRLGAYSWDLPNIMHHKVFIIDGKTVVTGSYNPTKAGTTRNSENVLIITDEAIATQYYSEYERLRSESKPRK